MREDACKPAKRPVADWKKHGGRMWRGAKTLPLVALCFALAALVVYALLRLGIAIAHMSEGCMTVCDALVALFACLAAVYFIGMGRDDGERGLGRC